MLCYRVALPLSRRTLNYTAGLIRIHRSRIMSPWRALTPAHQALLVLVYLRKSAPTTLALGFGDATTTAWRYVCKAAALPDALRWPRRADQRRAEELACPAESPLLPATRRAGRPSGSCASGPRDRMKKRQ
ncbi:hypothetical protein GCM10009799_33650 [Nocardiopsis rhodophaea]|uniref:Transposase Helix-turn-helix domain-containing protein n=1 Tax=Nocardiopsis rhodophaea TaxID=280238 RepID=A0ABN2TBE0_9ACTN